MSATSASATWSASERRESVVTVPCPRPCREPNGSRSVVAVTTPPLPAVGEDRQEVLDGSRVPACLVEVEGQAETGRSRNRQRAVRIELRMPGHEVGFPGLVERVEVLLDVVRCRARGEMQAHRRRDGPTGLVWRDDRVECFGDPEHLLRGQDAAK